MGRGARTISVLAPESALAWGSSGGSCREPSTTFAHLELLLSHRRAVSGPVSMSSSPLMDVSSHCSS